MTNKVPITQRISGFMYCSTEQIIFSLSPTPALTHHKQLKDMWQHALEE